MKSIVSRFGIVLVVATMLVPFASAQAPAPIHANVPFDFIVGEQVLPAGVYQLKPIAQGSRCWQIKGDKASAFVNAGSALDNTNSNPPRLTFHRYERLHFLREIHALGDWGLHATPREMEVAKSRQPETREVAAR